jgi:hypothetical protein
MMMMMMTMLVKVILDVGLSPLRQQFHWFNDFSPIFKGQEIQVLDFLTLEDGTDTLSRNVGKGLPLDAA